MGVFFIIIIIVGIQLKLVLSSQLLANELRGIMCCKMILPAR